MKSKTIKIQEIIDLLSSFNNIKDIKEYYAKMLEFLAKLTDSDISSVYIPCGKGLELIYYVEKKGNNFELIRKENYYLPFDKGIVGWVYRNKSPYFSDNTDEDSFYIPLEGETKSDIALPLMIDDRIAVILNFESFSENKFSKEDIENLNLVVLLFSILLQTKLQMDKIESENRFSKFLSMIYRTANEYEDLDFQFSRIIKLLVSIVKIERSMIFLLDEEGKELKIVKSLGLSKEEEKRGRYKIGEGIVGKVIKYRKSISIKNIWEEKDFLNKTRARRERSRKISFFANPIIHNDEILGVITAEKEFINDNDFEITGKIMEEVSKVIASSVMRYIRRREENKKLLEENQYLKNQLYEKYRISNIIGKSEKMLKVFEIINTVSPTNSTVLIEGESGTGKELIAKAIHFNSPRKEKPFIAINCAAIPENLLESELFGYKKGSFTGAVSDKKGKILLADKGTLFLDEIGDMPLHLQAKILRVLQEKEVEPIGGEPIKVDVRIIAATNRDLEKLIEEGKFRLDLYYRLNVIKVELPPLRERKEDIPLLIEEFIKKFSSEHGKEIKEIENEVLEKLIDYNWPGNVRELENTIERLVILSKDGRITKELMPEHLKKHTSIYLSYEDEISSIIFREIENLDIYKENNLYDKIIKPIEKNLIKQILSLTSNNKLKASRILGINRNTLDAYIKKYQINLS
ncbi:MAG: sigma-54-dependent Fis family transcriptional regulator [Brevinematia bacterium]